MSHSRAHAWHWTGGNTFCSVLTLQLIYFWLVHGMIRCCCGCHSNLHYTRKYTCTWPTGVSNRINSKCVFCLFVWLLQHQYKNKQRAHTQLAPTEEKTLNTVPKSHSVLFRPLTSQHRGNIRDSRNIPRTRDFVLILIMNWEFISFLRFMWGG